MLRNGCGAVRVSSTQTALGGSRNPLEIIPMIRIASKKPVTPKWHEVFLQMAPAIKTHAELVFRGLRPEAKAEAVQNALCCACAAVARLGELGKLDLCYPTVMARYAVAQTKDGRMLGHTLNCKDVSSQYCRQRKDLVLERLDKYDEKEEHWKEVLIADKTCTPAELAASRIDVPAWFATLKSRDRKVAKYLSLGHKPSEAATKFNMSRCRISQLRRELHESWRNFCGEAQESEEMVPC